MKYGKLFKHYINDYNHSPTTNRCSTLPHKELKLMAKNMYMDAKRFTMLYEEPNPLTKYQQMNHSELILAVYNALNILYE